MKKTSSPTKVSLETVHQFQRDFCANIRTQGKSPAPSGTADRGMKQYRKLMLNNISGFIDACFPVLQKMVGQKTWDAWCLDFYAHTELTTPYFRDIPKHFVEWLERKAKKGKVEDYWAELAHWEWVELAVSQSPDAGQKTKKKNHINVTAKLEHYAYPVHTFTAKRKVVAGETFLMSWRMHDGSVRFMELTEPSYRLLKKLKRQPDTKIPKAAQSMIKTLIQQEVFIEGKPISSH